MSNAKHVLERMQIRTESGYAIQDARERIVGQDDQLAAAVNLINSLITVPDVSFTDKHLARLTALAIVEAACKADEIDDITVYTAALERAKKLREDPTLAFVYVEADVNTDGTTVRHGEELKTMAGTDIKVLVKSNGKIKKGGKQVLAAELYKKHVLEATPAATNQEFIAILVKQLDMSKSGATTYAYNCKKQLGEPAGGIVKAKKGRKAK
jgi:hypothetical protein